jgi:hypothetical protein
MHKIKIILKQIIHKMSENNTDNLSYLVANAPSKVYATKLIQLIDSYSEQKLKIEKTKEIDFDIKNKIMVTLNFIKFIKTISKYSKPSIFGSFPRMLFERAFCGLYDKTSYGNTINHDVDLYLFENKIQFIESDFSTLITILNLMKSNITFGNYKIHSIVDKTITSTSNVNENVRDRMENIPHYCIILQNETKYIKYDLLGYKIESSNSWTNEFDINSLSITSYGISCDENFYDTIINIMNHSAECTIDFEKIIKPLNSSCIRANKVKILNDIVFFSYMRTKILSLGYTDIYNEKFGNLILSIEKESDCNITGLKPPYIQIELVCGHECSLMVLAGIINIRASADTESILCPLCRHQLIPKLTYNVNPNKLQNYNITDSLNPIPVIPAYELGEEIISKENKDYIYGLMNGLTLEQITSGRFNNHEYNLVIQ